MTGGLADDRLSRLFTTGDLANLFVVSTRTVCKWVDCNGLACWRFPVGSRDRRVTARSLAAWLSDRPDILEYVRGRSMARLRIDREVIAAVVAEADRLAAGLSIPGADAVQIADLR